MAQPEKPFDLQVKHFEIKLYLFLPYILRKHGGTKLSATVFVNLEI